MSDAAKTPRRLDAVTLLCVETRRPALAMHALECSLHALDFAAARLLSPTTPATHPRIGHGAIADFGDVRAYSEFMLHGLGDHFATSHALVVQWDGFVLDPACWDDAFLDYDYIGAPWPGTPPLVGNGGFSLRSRRLVDALRGLAVDDPHPEDAVICVQLRERLERDGIRFAPVELARRFAFEREQPDGPTFGFHGLFNFDLAFDEDALVDWFALCDDAVLRSVPARRLLRNLLRTGKHRAASALAARRRSDAGVVLDELKLRLGAPFARGRRVV